MPYISYYFCLKNVDFCIKSRFLENVSGVGVGLKEYELYVYVCVFV